MSKQRSISVKSEGSLSLTCTMEAAPTPEGGVEKEEMQARLKLYAMIFATAQPMALRAAILLNIPQIIALHNHAGSLSVEDIASHISSSTHSLAPSRMEYLFRILRFLASAGVFTETPALSGDIKQCQFGLTPLSKLLLPNGRSCAPTLLMATDKIHFEPWQHLHDSVLEGCHAFTKCHGMDMWEYADKHPQTNRVFNEAMASESRELMSILLETYNGFRHIKRLVDVGGGVGSAISLIVNKYNYISGINYDLPHVVASASPILGVQHVGGNMFEHIPWADAIFMKRILHDWEDQDCVRVLKKCHDALPPSGKLIIVDIVIEDENGGSNLRQLELVSDIMMMINCPGGKERTENEFKQLFLLAGFKEYTIIKLPMLQQIIEVTK